MKKFTTYKTHATEEVHRGQFTETMLLEKMKCFQNQERGLIICCCFFRCVILLWWLAIEEVHHRGPKGCFGEDDVQCQRFFSLSFWQTQWGGGSSQPNAKQNRMDARHPLSSHIDAPERGTLPFIRSITFAKRYSRRLSLTHGGGMGDTLPIFLCTNDGLAFA
jgi:hypothetical protein